MFFEVSLVKLPETGALERGATSVFGGLMATEVDPTAGLN